MKKRKLDEKAAEKLYPEGTVHDAIMKDAFLAGARYGRRTAVAALEKEPILGDSHNASTQSEFWKGVLAGKIWAIKAIKARNKK